MTDALAGPYNSPRFGSQATVNVMISSEVANGEVGFATVEDAVVQEPNADEPTLQIPLKVYREGTNGDVTVFWSLTGTGENAAFVTPSDTGPTLGSVTMVSGTCHSIIQFTTDTKHFRSFCEWVKAFI